MAANYLIRLMFEWGGGCLWCGNDAARERFDVGPIEDRLPLSASIRSRLDEMSAWHDGALNWNDPMAPSPWSPEEDARFEKAADELLAAVRAELGAEFEVVREPLVATIDEPPVRINGGSQPTDGGWKVYGRDTFAHEHYFIGAFQTEAEARQCAREYEEQYVKSQPDETLCDFVWVEGPDSPPRLSR